MATTVNHPSSNPTAKLTAATIAGAAMSVIGLILRNKFPEWYDPEVLLALSPVAAYAAGWLVRDRPNITVITKDAAQ